MLCCVLLISWVDVSSGAQSPFEGSWKLELAESQSSTRIYTYLRQDNTYHRTLAYCWEE
jgi:hypothetical protein